MQAVAYDFVVSMFEPSFFFQAEDGIRDWSVTGVQTCALPISGGRRHPLARRDRRDGAGQPGEAPARPRDRHLRSEEHTSELQSLTNLVCRLLLEKKKLTQCRT